MGTPRYGILNQNPKTLTSYDDNSFRAMVLRGDTELILDDLISQTDAVLGEIQSQFDAQQSILQGMLDAAEERNQNLENQLSESEQVLQDVFARFQQLQEDQREAADAEAEANAAEAREFSDAATDAILGDDPNLATDVAPARAIGIAELFDRGPAGRGGSTQDTVSQFLRTGGQAPRIFGMPTRVRSIPSESFFSGPPRRFAGGSSNPFTGPSRRFAS